MVVDASTQCCLMDCCMQTVPKPEDQHQMQLDNDFEENEPEETPVGDISSDYFPSQSSNTSSSHMSDEPDCREADEMEEIPLHRERKFIIFKSSLEALLSLVRCPHCGGLDVGSNIHKVRGTMVVIRIVCENCGHSTHWNSQPYIRSMPAGNILLSAGILFAGKHV